MEWNNSCNNFTQQVCGFRIVVVVFALKKRDRYLTPGNSAKTWPFLGWWVKTWPFNSKVINVTSNGWGLKGHGLIHPWCGWNLMKQIILRTFVKQFKRMKPSRFVFGSNMSWFVYITSYWKKTAVKTKHETWKRVKKSSILGVKMLVFLGV